MNNRHIGIVFLLLTAIFSCSRIEDVFPERYTLVYSSNGNGSILGVTNQSVLSGGSGTPVEAVPDSGFGFVHWSDGSTANPRTDSNVFHDVSVTAIFLQYTLHYSAAANGSIVGAASQTVIPGSNGNAVTATPNAGFAFTQWSDGRTDNPRTDTNVLTNVSVTAYFSQPTLTYHAGTHGSISGTTPQTIAYGGDGTAVSAIPDSGYVFVQWSDGKTDNPRTDTNVSNDVTVTAEWAQLPTVTTSTIAGNLLFTPYISGTNARGGGEVSSQGDSIVVERGLCWNTTGTPVITDAKIADGSGTGVFSTAVMTGLATDTVYYVRAYARNSYGTAYGNQITVNSGKTFGTSFSSGLVFYNDGNGGGLVAHPSDQSSDYAWITGGSTQTTLNGNTASAIGAGATNTTAIIAQSGHTGSAASLCRSLGSAWFLPSRDEAYYMMARLALNGLGNFAADMYWSSTELDFQYASSVSSLGNDLGMTKNSLNRVRACKKF